MGVSTGNVPLRQRHRQRASERVAHCPARSPSSSKGSPVGALVASLTMTFSLSLSLSLSLTTPLPFVVSSTHFWVKVNRLQCGNCTDSCHFLEGKESILLCYSLLQPKVRPCNHQVTWPPRHVAWVALDSFYIGSKCKRRTRVGEGTTFIGAPCVRPRPSSNACSSCKRTNVTCHKVAPRTDLLYTLMHSYAGALPVYVMFFIVIRNIDSSRLEKNHLLSHLSKCLRYAVRRPFIKCTGSLSESFNLTSSDNNEVYMEGGQRASAQLVS